MTASNQTFRGPTLSATMTRVKEAMGPAAVILATRERWDRRGEEVEGYEILASREPPALDAGRPAETAGGARTVQALVDTLGSLSHSADRWGEAADALEDLRYDVATLAATRATTASAGFGAPPPEVLALVEGGVEPQLARSLFERAYRKSHPSAGLAVVQDPSLEAEIRSLVRTAPPIWARDTPTVVAVVGPPGAGKTTSAVKLAAVTAFVHYRRVAMISMDAFRIGHAEQLVAYAELMDIPVRVANSPDRLEAALLAFRDCDLVVIDTPGHGRGDPEALARTTRWLDQVDRAGRPLTRLLVMSATARADVLAQIGARYAEHGIESTLITRMDEVPGPGAMVGVAWASRLPIAHLCHGQSVPDTITAPDVDALVETLCPRQRTP
jgi:flagellar biosynthesis protein FlhF